MKKFYFLTASMLLSLSAMANQAPAYEEAEVSTDIITETPEGRLEYYNETAFGSVYYGWGDITWNTKKDISSIVWADNNEVYIKDLVFNYSTNSWVKGTYADGQVYIQFPQCIGTYYQNGEVNYMYANILEEVYVQDEEHDGRYYQIVDADKNHAIFDVDEAGNLHYVSGNVDQSEIDTANGVNPQYVIGLTYENTPHAFQVWSGCCMAYADFKYLDNGDPVCPPSDKEVEHWGFETRGKESLINVVRDGNDIYISNLNTYASEFWVKGTFDGDKLVFPNAQYLGINQYGQFYYFLATKIVESNGWNTYEIIDAVTLQWDEENQKASPIEPEAFIFSGSNESIKAYAYFENPSLWAINPEMWTSAPLDPVFKSFSDYNPNTGKGSISFDLPSTNQQGVLIPTNQMYYNFYVDGELFTFEPDQYPLFEEPVTNVPYAASNFYDIYVYNLQHTIYFKFSDPETFGIQTFFVAADGTEYASDTITYDCATGEVTSSIKSVSTDAEAIGVTYTNLSGQVVEHPTKGFYIRVTTFADGTRRAEKIVVR